MACRVVLTAFVSAAALLGHPRIAWANPGSERGIQLSSPTPRGSTQAVPPIPALPEPPTTRGYPEVTATGRGGLPPTGDGIAIPSRIATRLRVLDADLTYLGSQGRNRTVDGILSMVTGALSIALGLVVDENALPEYLYLYGGAGVARGVLQLVLDTDPSDVALAYAHMPMNTQAEVAARLRYGETELEDIATTARLARILDAGLNIATGAAFVPLYLGPNDFEVDTFGAIVLVTAGVSVVTGVVSLFSPSEAERRYGAYEEMKTRLDQTHDATRPVVRVRVAASPQGGLLGLHGRF